VATIFSVVPKTSNIGNDLIALATGHLLREALAGEPVHVVSVPAKGASGQKPAGLTRRSVYDMNQLADGVLVGGGNLFENGALEVDRQAASALSAPLLVFGISAGRVVDRRGELALRTDRLGDAEVVAACRPALAVLVRDQPTADHLLGLGVEATVAACPTLFLADATRDVAPDPALRGAALVSIRHPDLMSVPHSVRGRVQADVERLVLRLRREHADVRLVCHDYQDLAFAARFSGVSSLYTEDARQLVGWLQAAAVCVTYRLHGFMACLSLGVPTVNVSYDERSAGLVAAVGLGDWDVDLARSRDVVAAVGERLDSLGTLARSREALLADHWAALRARQRQALDRFAAAVRAERARRVL
jgi:polysaccharide pyruvyl transferase WcaK-like protein